MAENQNYQKLIQACILNDKAAWNSFVDSFSKLIYWSIHKTLEQTPFSSRNDVADDIFQEIFKSLLEKKKLELLLDATSLPRFLTVLACRATLDKVRELSRFEKRRASIEVEESSGAAFFARKSLTGEETGAVQEALAGLSAKERVCVELCWVEGKTHLEIAKTLCLPQDTVSSIIRRTRQKLKENLEKRGF